jgi:hypothetical protein
MPLVDVEDTETVAALVTAMLPELPARKTRRKR